MIEVPNSLEKDSSRARIYGGVYEFQFAGLVALRLRALRRRSPDLNLRFSLATNVDGANPFDDIVLYLRWVHKGHHHAVTYFVQLKHKENTEVPVSGHNLVGNSKNKDFKLRHYYEKFMSVIKKVSQTPEEKLTPNQKFLRDRFNENYRLVILTTKEVYPKKKRSSSSLDFPFEKLLFTGQGEMFSFGEPDDDIWNMMGKCHCRVFQQEFLPRLRIFSAQSQVTRLQPLMVEAIDDALGGNHSRTEHVMARYVAYLQTWWASSSGNCLSEATCELEELFREDIHEDLSQMSFQKRRYNELLRRLVQCSASYIVIPGISDNFRCSIIRAVLERSNPGWYTILTDKTFKESSNFVIESLCSSKLCKEIVICVKRVDRRIRRLIPDIIPGKCIRILTSDWDRSVINLLESSKIPWNAWTERWMLADLSHKEQKKLLSKKVYVQGQETTLMALHESWPSLRRGIHGATLETLVTGKTLSFGDKLAPLDPLYIERTIEHKGYNRNTVSFEPKEIQTNKRHSTSNIQYEVQFERHHLKNTMCNLRTLEGRFLVTGFPTSLLNEMRSPNSVWEECNSLWIPLHKTRRRSWPMIDLEVMTKWSLWTNINPPAETMLQKNVKMYWLRYEGGRIVCEILEKEIKDMRIKVKQTRKCKKESVCFHNDISELRLWDGVSFLASDPGIGKTTFLMRMSHALKEKFPLEWVLLVRISHGTLIEDVRENVRIKDITTLLTRVAHSQEMTHLATRHFIEDCIKRSGNISILLDGVDEVCPSHKRKALRLLELLVRETRFKRLWVAARPVIEEDLARTLRCPPLRLRPFSPEQQRLYLLRHWAEQRTDETVRQLEDRVDRLLEAVRNATERDGRTLCDVPLYMKMLAEAYMGDYSLSNGVRKSFLYVNITRLKIMKKFLEETRNVYWAKIDVPMGKIKNVGWDISSEETFLRHHKACAMTLLFTEKVLNILNNKVIKEMKEIVSVLETEKTGIIVKIVDGKPVFVHRIFAEYFAALWLSENYKLLPRKVEFLYDGCLEEVRYFFDAILAEGNPLHEAAGADSIYPVLTVLRRTNEDLEKEDKGGRRALHLAAISGHEGAVRALLDKGADMRVIDKVLGWTPFRYSWMMVRVPDEETNPTYMKHTVRHLAVTEHFLQSGMKQNDIPNFFKRKEILSIAIQNDFPLIAEIFIRKGKILFLHKLFRQEYMHEAAKHDSVKVMSMLLRMGFNVNELDEMGATPLHHAATNGHMGVCQFLIQNGANLNQPDKMGVTPLHRASAAGHDDVCRLLTDRGADPHIKKSPPRKTTQPREFSGDEDDDNYHALFKRRF